MTRHDDHSSPGDAVDLPSFNSSRPSRGAEVTLDPILTPGEVADLLRMRKSWVYNAARTGELPHLRLGRAVRFRRSAIDAYLAGHRVRRRTARRPRRGEGQGSLTGSAVGTASTRERAPDQLSLARPSCVVEVLLRRREILVTHPRHDLDEAGAAASDGRAERMP